MLRLSKLADYGVALLTRLGSGGALLTAPQLSGLTGIGEPTVAKVLKTLSHAGLVEAQRGVRGGYRLSRSLGAVSLAEVVVAIDGPIALTACVDGATGGCEAEGTCPVRGRWDPVNEAIRAALSAVSLADLARPACGELHARRPVVPASKAAAPVAAE